MLVHFRASIHDRSPHITSKVPEPHTRPLGLAVLRGPTITVIHPVEGTEEIANPFLAAEE